MRIIQAMGLINKLRDTQKNSLLPFFFKNGASVLALELRMFLKLVCENIIIIITKNQHYKKAKPNDH